jgi:uncharacterized protein YegL
MEWRIERPVVPPAWRQLGVLVLDGSGSMTLPVEGVKGFNGAKAEAVSMAVRELFTRFKASDKKESFSFSVVSFHERVSHVMEPTLVEAIDDYADYDPTSHGSGGTFIGAGLERALEICEKFFADNQNDLPTSAVVLLMTDGECSAPERTGRIAARLTANPRIKLAAAFFATKGQAQHGAAFLRGLCSEKKQQYFRLVYDPETLRKFWIASMSAAAGDPGHAVSDQ